MFQVLLSLAAAAALSSLACSKKDQAQENIESVKGLEDSDALPVISRLPTRPEGGEVPGKVDEMDPEESVRRKTKNEILPIEFGVSVAGINMKTTKKEARGILAAPLGAAQGFEFYPEHIRVLWDQGDAPRPELVVVDEGYGGTLSLPAPYGKISVGQAMPMIKDEAGVRAFLKAAGATFEGKSPADYDCEVALSCRLLSASDSYELQFKKGGILMATDASKKVQLLYFQEPRNFYPRVTAPMLYGTAIGGVDFNTTRSSFEAKYGPPEETNGPFAYYDLGSIRVAWGQSKMPLAIGALRTFGGSMNIGGSFGERKIGDSFASYIGASSTNPAKDLMLALDRQLEARAAADFDCSAQAPALCTFETDGDLLLIELAKGIFVFTADSEKRWLLYQVSAP